MRELIPSAGKYRRGNLGIIKGSKVSHVAPPAARVPMLMRQLFELLRKERETPGLIRAAVFHYEMEFIHPFDDGNGRVGRFWQHLLFQGESSVFRYVPAESLIRARQADYLVALEHSDRAGSCETFIELMLLIAEEGLRQIADDLRAPVVTPDARLDHATAQLDRRWFRRKDYLTPFTSLSTSTASRDLRHGLDAGRGSATLTAPRGLKLSVRRRGLEPPRPFGH